MGLYDVENEPTQRSLMADRPQLPYLIPYFAFLLVMLPGQFFGPTCRELWFTYYPAVYTAKTILAAALLWTFWRYYTPIKWSHLALGVLVGLVGLGQWIGTELLTQAIGLTHPPKPFDPTTVVQAVYDPVRQIPNLGYRYAFYAIRTLGPALVVPVMEELFFRDFLMRALVRGARFQDVAVGTFTWVSLIGMSVVFAAEHVQWPAGFIYGLMMGILLIRTKSLGACIVAHGVTNLTLGLYVISSGDWQFW